MRIKRKEFISDGTRLIIEDRISVLGPYLDERLLRIAGTNAYYSAVPLNPDNHNLLCFQYCADAMKMRDSEFYQRALVLGCGGGAIPRWLLYEYPSVSIDVVDRSPEIISNCKEYFMQGLEDAEGLTFHCVDARDYESEEPYQFIFCDLFNGESVAPVVYDPEFAWKLRRLAGDDGLLVINCGWDSPMKVHGVYQNIFEYIQTVNRKSWQTQVVKASGDLRTLYG